MSVLKGLDKSWDLWHYSFIFMPIYCRDYYSVAVFLGITKICVNLLQARKALRRLKGILRLQLITQSYPVQKQSTTTLNLLHSWCKIQAQIRARRLCMVTEGRIKQKKLENRQKLEAKLHGLEVISLAFLSVSFALVKSL